ncbi:MAG: hypothetical protein FD166_1138 [Bacteroidetes bacterium]|nr:MAG: hypothetical protein FD166_1138 [Bacteroidota bacterium]
MHESNVVVDSNQCLAISNVLLLMEFREGFTRRPFLNHPLKKETRLAMLFYAVAICHQTRSLRSAKCNLFGWDYIEKVFLDLALKKSALLIPESLGKDEVESIASALESAFSDDGNPVNTTLDSIEERVGLMKDLSRFLQIESGGSFSHLIEKTGGLLYNQGSGFYEMLEKTDAFGDPMRKKSSFLLKLLIDSGLFVIRDRENYIPIMDYHMQRVLLRLGCIRINDRELLGAIKKRALLPTDQPVRKACIEAVNEIARYSGIEVWKMNDIFWSLGRSCCNDIMLCLDEHCSKEPCTFQTIVLIPEHKNCSFESVCSGYGREETRLLWEPIVETHYY